MECPKCECELRGIRCACGYQQPALAVTAITRRWKTCEWISAGSTCQAPTGTLGAEGEGGRFRPPRLCAYHRERERWSLFGTYLSEEQVFLKWVEQFPPGTSYQPMPGIWDRDRGTLWLLVSGQMTWEHFRTVGKETQVA